MNKKLSKKEAGAVKATVAQAQVKATIRDMGEFKGDFVITALPKAPRVGHNQEWQELVDGLTVSQYAGITSKDKKRGHIEISLGALRYFVKHEYIVIGPVATN